MHCLYILFKQHFKGRNVAECKRLEKTQNGWQNTYLYFQTMGIEGLNDPNNSLAKKEQNYGESLTLDLISKIGLGGHFHRK